MADVLVPLTKGVQRVVADDPVESATKVSQAFGAKLRTGPPRFFESRTETAVAGCARTSTQSPFAEYVDFVHWVREARSLAMIAPVFVPD
ncbi:hypothetical protein BBN63_19695 [Streptomyces niveus]|uniref:Uncharacterized protein n=1 Tax=Streptomyces niveus TaxID=193462 RepID=A0A1U9QVJ7_STRNV|nr:hypothetical protein BBN63_19695 [Streptomyces niveus]